MPVASVIIPTKDRPAIIRQNLGYLQKAIAGRDIEVIVVNDGAADPDLQDFPFVRLVKNSEHGVASARNTGAELASSDRFIFLDDDMLIFPENISSILELTKDTPDCCINLNWIYPPEVQKNIEQTSFGRYLVHYGFTTLKGWNKGNFWSDAGLFETNGITSQFLYISRRAFYAAGAYTGTFPFAGFEDYDLAQKLREKNIRFYIYPLSTCWHNELDRLTAEAWLERKKRGAETRKHAVMHGHPELALQYGFVKKIIYSFILAIKSNLFSILNRFPNQKSFDFLYFRCVNLLLGAVVYEGYRKI